MKIGIDVRAACARRTGKGLYTLNIVRNLLHIDAKNEYILYSNKISADLAEVVSTRGVQIKLIHKNPLLWHFAVIKDFKNIGGDVFFSPTSFIIPAFLPKKIKSIITIHDLVAFIHPQMHETKATVLEHLFLRKALKKASRAVVPSENTKRDLMRIFHYPEAKITTTPLAADEKFFSSCSENSKASARKKYNLPDEFILTVAGLEPRKNLSRLVDAMLIISKNFKREKLVIVGGRGWKSKALQEKISRHKDLIIHVENCAFEDLPALYKLAKIFVFPSIYEGFGLPVIEAMSSGCPVICSNKSSLPEVCGACAIFINPENTEEIANAIQKLLADENLCVKLKEKGLARTKEFSWKLCAEKTLHVINNV